MQIIFKSKRRIIIIEKHFCFLYFITSMIKNKINGNNIVKQIKTLLIPIEINKLK